MVTIKIEEFEGYDIDEFTEFLLAQNDDQFEIISQKDGVLFFSPHNELAREFAIAAYIGQRLSEISSTFSYTGASLADAGEFTFQIKTKKIDELADILFLFSGGFGNSELSEPIDLASEVSHFIETTKPKDAACVDLLETYHEYYTPEESDAED
jgi:hypothetical protein